MFSIRGLRLYFPVLEPWVVGLSCSPVVPPGLSAREYGTTQSAVRNLPPGQVCQPPPCPPALLRVCSARLPISAWLPISVSPTTLDECFFFNSLVVRLPQSSIFCQFLLFFGFKFVVVLLLIVRGGKVYLPTPPSWPEALYFCFKILFIYF